jgi:hypothetical protein
VFALLGATALAFVVTEGLKLQPSPIHAVFVTKVFSPTCECETDFAVVGFKLRKAQQLTLSIVDGDRRVVRTLVGPAHHAKGQVTATWDGRDDAGAVVPDGVYRPRVHLRHRSIFMPNRINVDTTRPRLKIRRITFTPSGRKQQLAIRYRVGEPARLLVFLDGRRIAVGRTTRLRWKLEWTLRLKPGTYRLTAAARDVAGNRSAASRAVRLVVPLRVLTHTVKAAPGAAFTVRLVTDGLPYRWRLGDASGASDTTELTLQAPFASGSYPLVIRQHGARDVVRVRVG